MLKKGIAIGMMMARLLGRTMIKGKSKRVYRDLKTGRFIKKPVLYSEMISPFKP
jgi:hypothetical protein